MRVRLVLLIIAAATAVLLSYYYNRSSNDEYIVECLTDCSTPLLYSKLSNADGLIECDFALRSNSSCQLTAKVVQTSCSCHTILLDSEMTGSFSPMLNCFIVPPYGKAVIKVKSKVARDVRMHSSTTTLSLECNGKVETKTLGSVRTIIDDYQFQPSAINLNDKGGIREERECSLLISSMDNGKPKVVIHQFPEMCDVVQTGIAQNQPKAGIHSCSVNFKLLPKATIDIQELHTALIVNCNGVLVRLPLVVRRTEGLHVSNTSLYFGMRSLNEEVEKKFRLRSIDELPFGIVEMNIDDPNFTCSPDKGIGREVWVKVKFAGKSLGEHHAKLQLKTTHPKSPVLTIELSAACK